MQERMNESLSVWQNSLVGDFVSLIKGSPAVPWLDYCLGNCELACHLGGSHSTGNDFGSQTEPEPQTPVCRCSTARVRGRRAWRAGAPDVAVLHQSCGLR